VLAPSARVRSAALTIERQTLLPAVRHGKTYGTRAECRILEKQRAAILMSKGQTGGAIEQIVHEQRYIRAMHKRASTQTD